MTVRTYIHTYIHAYIHTCMHTYIHTYIHVLSIARPLLTKYHSLHLTIVNISTLPSRYSVPLSRGHLLSMFQAYLKEILREVCLYHTKSPHKFMWELKPEYKQSQLDLDSEDMET